MTGSIPFGNIAAAAAAAPPGEDRDNGKHFVFVHLLENSVTNNSSLCFSCSSPSSEPSLEPPITAAGHTLPPAVQPVQPTSVSTLSFG